EKACARFNVTVMSGIVVGPSPDHLARRVLAAGMRPINNVVDASNLVMLETNQPNHAYDAAKVASGFRIRKAKPGETLTTLDGTQRSLDADDLLICDGDDHAGRQHSPSQMVWRRPNNDAAHHRDVEACACLLIDDFHRHATRCTLLARIALWRGELHTEARCHIASHTEVCSGVGSVTRDVEVIHHVALHTE
ncbi:MAG: hypothetical protein EBT38_06150, partial [Acidimicrobiia bacterium]|nr:hypothetical protein [Acidimicrobiia bacterium]